MLRKTMVAFYNARAKVVVKINRWLLKKSFAAAELKAKELKEKFKCKVWVLLWDKEYVAITKSDFKKMWQKKTEWKQRSIQQWQKYVHEY